MSAAEPTIVDEGVAELCALAEKRPEAAVAQLVGRCRPEEGGGDEAARLVVAVVRRLRDGAELAAAAAVVSAFVDRLAGRRDLDEDIEVDLVRVVGEIYSYHGRPQTGIELCHRLVRPRSPSRRIDHLVVLAALHRDAGDLSEARTLSDESLTLIERLDDPVRQCRILNNRGVLNLDLGHYEAAADDLQAALHLAEEHDLAYEASSCTHNLGVARARHGRVHEAFRLFDESFRSFGRLGSSYAMLAALVDRVAVLHDVGLLTDARVAAELSVASHRRFASYAGLEETLALQVRIEVADTEWAAAARHCAELLELLEQRSAPIDRRRAVSDQLDLLRSLADESQLLIAGVAARDLASRFDTSTAVEIGLYCCGHGRVADGKQLFDQVVEGVAPRRETLHRSVAAAWLAADRADRAGALRAIEDGYRYAVSSGMCLGPSDLRVTTLRRVRQLGEIGLGIARRDGDPRLAAGLLNRACGIASAREPDLSEHEVELLNRLREVHHAYRWSEVEASRQDYLRSELIRIENELRSVRRHRRGDDDPVVPVSESDLAGSRVVYLTRQGPEAVAVVVGAGDEGFVELGSFDQLCRRIGALMVVLDAVAAGTVPPDDVAPVRDGLRRLLDPLLRDDPSQSTVVVADTRLPPVPWSLLTGETVSHLPSIGGETGPVVPVPGAALSVVVGPGLDFTDRELRAIASVWPGTRRVGGPLSTVGDARRALEENELVHVSAHGRFRHDNPLFSEVALLDGPLTLYELLGLPLGARHVVFASCELGGRSLGSPLGAFAVLQTCGCRSMVASAGRIRDATMSELMGAYYRALDGTTTPAAALAAAQREVVTEDPSVAQILAFGPS